MVEKPSKNLKKGFISETDISSLLQRYTANTVLALLQEVAQFPGVKLDWNALVKKTSTGISNSREYQMLWRHLAYRNALLEKLEDEAQPLDDDSDLEYELEALPEVSGEASTEAAACVKVLIASGLPSDSGLPNSSTVEAPLTINIPKSQSFRASLENSQPSCLMQGMNITVPVSVQKLPLPTSTSTESLDANRSISGNLPPRKKRKPWTPEEDIELISAVQKCGEGNWANILRGDFKWDRTASQLSQRWTILRKKKHGNMILGSNLCGSQLSEAQLAARHAMSLALDMPVKNIAASCTNNAAGTSSNTAINNSVPSTANAEASPASGSLMPVKSPSEQGPIQTKSSPVGSPGSAAKSRVPFKKMPVKSNFSADSSIRAAAVAAGARIGTSSDAASLLKGARGKNAIHIIPSVVSSIKSPIAGSTPVHLEASSSMHNVQTSLPAAPPSSNPAVTLSALHPGLVKAASPKVQHNASSELSNAVISVPGAELQKTEVKAGEEIKVSDLGSVSGNESSKKVQVGKTGLPKPETELQDDQAVVEDCDCSSNIETVENDQVHVNGNKAEGNHGHDNDDKMIDSQVQKSENQAAVKENCGLRSPKNKEANLPTMFADGCSKNLGVSVETKASNH